MPLLVYRVKWQLGSGDMNLQNKSSINISLNPYEYTLIYTDMNQPFVGPWIKILCKYIIQTNLETLQHNPSLAPQLAH